MLRSKQGQCFTNCTEGPVFCFARCLRWSFVWRMLFGYVKKKPCALEHACAYIMFYRWSFVDNRSNDTMLIYIFAWKYIQFWFERCVAQSSSWTLYIYSICWQIGWKQSSCRDLCCPFLMKKWHFGRLRSFSWLTTTCFFFFCKIVLWIQKKRKSQAVRSM